MFQTFSNKISYHISLNTKVRVLAFPGLPKSQQFQNMAWMDTNVRDLFEWPSPMFLLTRHQPKLIRQACHHDFLHPFPLKKCFSILITKTTNEVQINIISPPPPGCGVNCMSVCMSKSNLSCNLCLAISKFYNRYTISWTLDLSNVIHQTPNILDCDENRRQRFPITWHILNST